MARPCPHKKSPEFIRIQNLTGLEPSEISMAINIWQDHNQTNEWPSALQVAAMAKNRQSYGGMDQYLAAISQPLRKVDLASALANLPKRIEAISSVLNNILPGVKFILHKSDESAIAAQKEARPNDKQEKADAFWNSDKKQIHLNIPSIVRSMSIRRKAAINDAEHEAVHPILEALESISPGTIGSLYDSLIGVEKEFGLDGAYTKVFAGKYNSNVQKEEAITEFIADIASGAINLKNASKTRLELISQFFVDLFKGLGINIKPYIKNPAQIVKLANDIKESFAGNKELKIGDYKVTKNKGLKFSLAGEQGARELDRTENVSTRIDNLGLARKMTQAKNSVRHIKAETSWEKGTDGKWKYEMQDVIAREGVDQAIFRTAVNAQTQIKILNNNKDYDKAKRAPLIAAIENLYKELGYEPFERENGRKISEALIKNNEALLPTPTITSRIIKWKEIRKEGIAQLVDVVSGDILDSYPQLKKAKIDFAKLPKGIDAVWNQTTKTIQVSNDLKNHETAIRSGIVHELQHAIQFIEGFALGGNIQQFLEFTPEESTILDKYITGDQTREEFLNDPDVAEMISALELNDITDIIKTKSKINIEKILKDDELSASQKYIKLAGEAEARNVERRINLTKEQRRNSILADTHDVANEDQILLFDNIGQINQSTQIKYLRNDLVAKTEKATMMTVKDGDYIFYNYDKADKSKLHTEPFVPMIDQGYPETQTSIPRSEVYPLEEDPNGYITEPGNIYDQLTEVKAAAKKDGFKIIVYNQDDKTIAEPVSTPRNEAIEDSNPLKFSLAANDNEDNAKTPYEETVAFGKLVNVIMAKTSEGVSDIVKMREIAGVTSENYEQFQDAYDLAMIRSGKAPSNTRQQAIYDLIKRMPKEGQRITAQSMYRKKKNMLDALRINPVMLKQILPDEDLIKDKNINQTWKRLLNVVDDIGSFVSNTLNQGKKFEITDTEGNETGYWDHAALGFSNMLAFVNNAVEEDPTNKEKLLANVKEALKGNENDDMLQLLEVAIAASGETSLADLSKVVRAGTLAGRVLNVIKRYIGSGKFGQVQIDLAAATIMAENDQLLSTVQVSPEQDAATLLDIADEIREIIKLNEMSEEERDALFEENPELFDNINKFLKNLNLGRTNTAIKDKRAIQRGKVKITLGIASLTDALKRTHPEFIKYSKSNYDDDVLKSLKQIIRGLIDIHGSDKSTLRQELGKVLKDANITMSARDILEDNAIKEYIDAADRNKIRSNVIDSLGASKDNYTKLVIDHVLKVLNINTKTGNKIDALANALDRGELTKEVLDAVRQEIESMPDEEKRNELLKKLDDKFVTVFEGAVSAKVLSDAVSKALGKVTRDIVTSFIADPERSVESLAANAMDKLGMNPSQAKDWAAQVAEKTKEKLAKAKKTKIKSLLSTKISNKSKAESIEEKVFKIIESQANPDGTIPSETEIDGQMMDIKQTMADKYGVNLNDPKAIANVVRLTQLLRNAKSQARRDQLQGEIMLKIKNLKLSPNKKIRILLSGISEIPTFVIANILDSANTAYKAAFAGFYNTAKAFVIDNLIGRGIDWHYKGRSITNETIKNLNNTASKSPASHMMANYRLLWDVMRNGSAAVSQSNIPEHGLSNFDTHANNFFAIRLLYSNFRFLSAIDIATMNFNHPRLAYRKAINSLHEFGKNNVVLNGQNYSRTIGGASWYKVDAHNMPPIDPNTGNVLVIRDKNEIKILNDLAKQSISTTDFLVEVERLLGLGKNEEVYKGIIDEWNALVDLKNSQTATKEEKEELKKLHIDVKGMRKVTTMEDFKKMSGSTRRFVAIEIYKKVKQNEHAAIKRYFHMEAGSYSAQGTEIPGIPGGLLYQSATILDKLIKDGLASNNTFHKGVTYSIFIPAKIYSALITKAPSIGYAAALAYTPISFLLNLVNLMAHYAGRPYIRVSYDAKDKVWRYNGLSMQDLKNATGVTNLSSSDLLNTTNEKVLQVLKEGYTVMHNENNTFTLKNPEATTIGGQASKTDIATILGKQAVAIASFAALLAAMFDCPDDDCGISPWGEKFLNIITLKGYGAAKQWLTDHDSIVEQYIGHRQVIDPFGAPHKNTIAVLPDMGQFQAKLPLNELNNAIAATTLARVVDEMKAGVKLTKEDIMLRYLIYSNFDLLQDNMDLMADGLAEFSQMIFSFFDSSYEAKKSMNKATGSISKRMMAALVPKMINDLDKMLLDKEDKPMYSAKVDGFWVQIQKKIPLNAPFLRRYVVENDPETYKKLPFNYEWTDWQLYLKRQLEDGDVEKFGIDTGEYIINRNGRVTLEAPDGEVAKLKRNAQSAGKAEYVENGYFKVGDQFDFMLAQAIKDSNMNSLLAEGKEKEALDLIRDLAKAVKADSEFTDFKRSQYVAKEPGEPGQSKKGIH